MELIIQYLFSGLTAGSIYAIVAIGFNIIYSATGIINFAQGEFVMLGGMTAFSLSRIMPLLPAVLIAVLVTAGVGSAVELLFIRRMRKPTVLKTIVLTIGLSILIREAALHIWDEQVRALPFFSGTETSSVNIFGAYMSPQVFWILGITALAASGLQVFLKKTAAGRVMRACASDPLAASLCGVNTRRIVNLTFALSAGMGALGGCVVAPLTQLHYAMGTDLAIKGFTVAILGGLGNTGGAAFAGLLLGLLESFSISVLPAAYQDVIAMAILLLVLFIKPAGLFGSAKMSALKEHR
ncbi:MAG: branched-chain amino acid ABC transporter permease [Spirochaetia bacterium]